LSAVRDCLFRTFAATLHTWRPYPPSATRRLAIPRSQELTWYGQMTHNGYLPRHITETHPKTLHARSYVLHWDDDHHPHPRNEVQRRIRWVSCHEQPKRGWLSLGSRGLANLMVKEKRQEYYKVLETPRIWTDGSFGTNQQRKRHDLELGT